MHNTSDFDKILTILVHLIHEVNRMNSNVTALVSQVAANVAEEGKVATALVALKSQVAQLQTELAKAIADGFQPDDVAALQKAVSDLAASATALSAA